MKKPIGLLILVIVLIAASGCAQQAEPVTVPTPETTVATPVPTTETTPLPTTVITVSPPVTPVNTTTAPATTPLPIQTPQTKNTIIYMRNTTFVPTELTVLPGTGITWVNEDTTVHAVKTTGDHAGMFNSGEIIPGGRWGYTFGEREGTFEFTCTYHPDMKGRIVVRKGLSVVGAPPLQTQTTPA